MAGSNTNIQITDLDFDSIKTNFINYLKSQDVLKDYNYDGSALSVLLDVLAYNTQYNAYYLNMVANEMFLDSALQRDSVISLAKLLNYTPKSATAPEAIVNVVVNQVTNDASLTLPKYTTFLSEAIDGVNYTFVNDETVVVDVVNNTATFNNLKIKQGTPAGMSYVVDSTQNPKYTFKIPEINVDTNTLSVTVQETSTNTSFQVYNKATSFLSVDGDSLVYFLQEGPGGYYEINFGNNVLGKKLSDGNIVRLSYLTTLGTSSYGANSFVSMNNIGGYSNIVVSPVSASSTGSAKESLSSIKFQAPKSYAAQGRAVTKEDYITAIQQNNLGFTFDSVNVWGGQENDPPIYGQVFISAKPNGGYTFTATQKQRLVDSVIKPLSVMTVQPTFVDPDYTYIQITANVVYDPKRTNLTAGDLKSLIKSTLMSYSAKTLNTFNSTFSTTDYSEVIKNTDPSIITNEINIQVQKKIFPILTGATTYKLHYGVGLKRGLFLSGINSSPSIKVRDPVTPSVIIDSLFVEEVPQATGGVSSISMINPGFGYQSTPTVKILGDGTGATAEAVLSINGTIRQINVTNKGSNYTSAIVEIVPASNDTTGQLASAIVTLEGRYGTLRTYYNNTQNIKKIFNATAGTVDYNMGVVTLDSFNPFDVNNQLGQLTITANPATTMLSSSYNRIITVDPFDPTSIIVNVTARQT